MGGRREPLAVAAPECRERACILEARHPERPDEGPYGRFEADRVASAALYLPPGVPMRVESFGLDGQSLAERTVCARCEDESAYREAGEAPR